MELFFPPRGSADEKALALCRSCPELEPCKTYALSCSPDTLRGIWGGLSERDRRSLRRGAAMSAALDDVDEPTDADLVAIEAAGPADPAATNGHGGRRCSECAGPIGPDRSDAAVTCSRACADARGGRKRAARQAQKVDPRAQLEARRPPDNAEASPDPLEVALSWFAGLPAAVTSLELAGGWRLERRAG